MAGVMLGAVFSVLPVGSAGAATAGQFCAAKDVGKRSGSLTCVRDGARYRWKATATTKAAVKSQPLAADPGRSCDASYPDLCIPPGSADLDCADVSARRFRVLPPDPHRFDSDGDGVGCES